MLVSVTVRFSCVFLGLSNKKEYRLLLYTDLPFI